MATYQYVTTKEQDAVLTRVLTRMNAGGQSPPLGSVADLVTLKVTEALDKLAQEQTSVELTRLANAFAQATLAGRDQISAAAETAKSVP